MSQPSENERLRQRLTELGLSLPDATIPQGAYVPYVRSGNLLFVAGQGPRLNGMLRHTGPADSADLSSSQEAACICALNVLAQAAHACSGDLGRIERIVRLAGLVHCDATFTAHASVLDGASTLFLDLFGERGRHARIASGAVSLPSGMRVEIEAVIALRD